MDGEGKTKQARSNRSNEDRISQLPDSLICDIFYHLRIEEAIKTSLLSTRWRSLWLWVPILELSSRRFLDLNAFVSFGGRFFDANNGSCMHKFYLDIDENEGDVNYFSPWIDAAVKRKVKHLHVQCPLDEYLYEMPLSLYTSKTLVSLTLNHVALANAEFVSLPCLKTMHLKAVWYPNEATFETLVSSCHVLEELEIFVASNDAKFYRVHSRSLNRLTLVRGSTLQLDAVSGVVIDAPQLYYLNIYDNVSTSFIARNLDYSNTMLVISLDFGLDNVHEGSVSSRRSRIRSFLPGILRVKDVALNGDTFKVMLDYSKLEPLPQFRYLSWLYVTLFVSDLKCLPTFLISCPKLESLTLALKDYEEMRYEEISFSYVPDCLLLSLKFVVLDMTISGYAAEMELVEYFLENSAMLKKLTLYVNYGSIGYDIFKELLKIPRRSATCEVVVI